MMIPENLGYIPYDNQQSEFVIEFAERNLAVRDGVASNFYHPFISLDILKEIVKEVEKLGYDYVNIKSLNNRIAISNMFIATGSGEYSLPLNDEFLSEFYVNPKGKIKNRTISDEKQTGDIKGQFECPTGWMYFAQGVAEKKRRFPLAFWTRKTEPKSPADGFVEYTPIQTSNRTAFPLIITTDTTVDSLSVNQKSFISAFESVGIDLQTIPVTQIFEIPETINLIVLPMSSAIALSDQQTLILLDYLARGGNIILERASDLCNRIGIIQRGSFKSAVNVQDEYYPQVFMQWKTKGAYRDFDVPIDYVTYYSERETSDPLVIGGEYGEGKYLYFTTLFDPVTGMGYARYPYFIDLLQRQFDVWPLVRRDVLEIYFEPGARENVSIEDLVKSWKRSGFRNIYVAGWHVYANWMYDYERLIELAHQNAMLVYLWLELPHVGAKFWDEHPEWREITAAGKEGMIDWRKHMALTLPECREAVFQELSKLLDQYDWDGVNLAELYFESAYDWESNTPYTPLGPESAESFTPMHPSVRKDFQSQYSFDPLDLFDQSSPNFWKRNPDRWKLFEDYRKGLIIQLHRQFLTFLHQKREEKNSSFEILVTVIDDILGKNIGRGTGTDTQGLMALADELPFTLQIEDPSQLWHLKPSRYLILTEAYRPLVKKKDLILDINIVPFRDLKSSLSPTSQQTGIELNQLISYAMGDSNRVALYSESTIFEVDLPWIAYSAGRHAKERFSSTYWEIESNNTISMDLNPETHKDVLVNGHLWPAYYQGKLILPAGKHRIEPIPTAVNLTRQFRSSIRIVDISSELDSCRIHPRGLEVYYHSNLPNYLIVNELPTKVIIDDKVYQPKIYHGNLGYSLKLPIGSHKVIIHAKSGGRFTLKNISLFTSLLIITISSLAVLSLFILYIRRFRKKTKVE